MKRFNFYHYSHTRIWFSNNKKIGEITFNIFITDEPLNGFLPQSFGRVQTDRQIDRQTNRSTNWLTNWPTDWPTDRLTNQLTDWLTDRKTDRQADRPTDRQTNKPIERSTDRLTNRLTNRQTDRQTDWEIDPLVILDLVTWPFYPIYKWWHVNSASRADIKRS